MISKIHLLLLSTLIFRFPYFLKTKIEIKEIFKGLGTFSLPFSFTFLIKMNSTITKSLWIKFDLVQNCFDMSVPKLFVFDLDGCCWEPEMYQLWGACVRNLKNCRENLWTGRVSEVQTQQATHLRLQNKQ